MGVKFGLRWLENVRRVWRCGLAWTEAQKLELLMLKEFSVSRGVTFIARKLPCLLPIHPGASQDDPYMILKRALVLCSFCLHTLRAL